MKKAHHPDPLRRLANVGPAMRRDLALLGIDSVAALAAREPADLYAELQVITGQPQDPCVLDTFMAIVHEARNGEALPWWHFTPLRKAGVK